MHFLAIPQNTKRVRAQTTTNGLGDGDGGSRRNGRIDRIAPFEHHAQTSLGRQRMRCGNHVARKQRQARGRIRRAEIKIHDLVQSDFAFGDDLFPFGRFRGQHGGELRRRGADGFNA